ncbi:MAG: single-stranded DNA-binding protein [Elusimicrobiales bacterium]|nr:single-stranded DNA-binding protein [Elusimicrobiales bacterium]
MANLNKVMLIGRLTRDPELTEFPNGGRVANVGFAVHNRRKNPQTGEWEEVPVWVNLKAYNREHGRKLADLAAKLHKGRQVFVEGHLAMEEWTGKEDGKRHQKMLVYVDAIEFMGDKPRQAGAPADHAPGEHVADGPEPDHAPGEHLADAGWPDEAPQAPKGKRGRQRRAGGEDGSAPF